MERARAQRAERGRSGWRNEARADPIDMDEDEKEMLSEARARLANTSPDPPSPTACVSDLSFSKTTANSLGYSMNGLGYAMTHEP